jgi:hypothetical protein
MMRTAIGAAVLAATAGHAVADDSAGTADTVASTWSGGALQLAEADKRFVLALTTLVDGIRARAEISAPLDAATRTATFVTRTGLAPAFRGSFHLGYDSTYRALDLEPSDGELRQYCDQHQIAQCTERKVNEDKQKARQRQGQPLGVNAQYWGVGLDLSYAYDRTTAYMNDVGAGPTAAFSATDLQIGGSGTLYVPGGWALSLRAGYERANSVNIGTFQRCVMLPSTVSSVTGQICSDEHYLRSDPGPQQSGYARLAGAYYPASSWLSHYASATELRLNFEDLGTDAASFDVHLLVFAKGLDIGGGSVRVGIGATIRTALASSMGAEHGRGDLYDYSLFGIAGTTF